MTIKYGPDGNILSKTGVGDYCYDAAIRPHAVIGVTNQKGIIPSAALETTYGDLNKINMISNGTYETTFSYGPDLQRWCTVEKKNDTDYRTIHYAPGIERVTLGGVTRTFFYLGHGVIVMQQGSTYIPLLTVTDHQGTIAGLVDATGTWQFDANYDAWGRQTVAKSSIGFQRGYTGHEMLPEYGLINMNGRLYDPLLGRFLSPDNYVQQPDNSQSFNRYSYCLNNPLKYTDPDGEFLHLIFGAIIGGTVNWATHGCKFNAKGLGYFGVGALAGAVGAGIGAGISSALPVADQTAGGFAAGFWRTSSATTATSSFFSGALIGGGVGFSGGFVSGFGNTLVDGGSIGSALKNGGLDALFGGVSGAAIGGLAGGIDAITDGRNFLHGGRITDEVNIDMPIMNQVGEFDCRYEVFRSNDIYFNGKTMSVEELRRLYPNVETIDLQMNNMYGRVGHLGLDPLNISNLSKVDAAQAMISEVAKGNTLIYEMSITPKYAHAVAISKVRIYDNGRILLKFMNPSGAGGYRTSNLKNVRQIFSVFKIH